MRFLIMPDSFKESLSAKDAAEAIKSGLIEVFSEGEFELIPVGDGGEGTMDALAQSISMTIKTTEVTGFDQKPVQMRYGTFNDSAFFEMADLVGLQLVAPEKRAPLDLTTQGLGELILKLINQGIKNIYFGVGGSATVDGGIGLAAGLGYKFFDKDQKELTPIGRNLANVAAIDDTKVPKAVFETKIMAITDVKNPLCGKNGASFVFGKQKGLKDHELADVDQALKNFYQLTDQTIFEVAGAGAGGGIAAAIISFAKGDLIHGIDFVLDILDFEKRAAAADFIIVGEGRMDLQSVEGKAPIGIAQRAPKDVPVLAICGSVAEDSLEFRKYGISAVFPIIGQPDSLAEILKKAQLNLKRTSMNIGYLIKDTLKKQK